MSVRMRTLLLSLLMLLWPAALAAQEGEVEPAADVPAAETPAAELPPAVEPAAIVEEEQPAGVPVFDDEPADIPLPAAAEASTDEPLELEEEMETEPAGEGPIYARGGLFGAGVVIGAKIGGGFGQLTSELGTSFVGELELGWTLPLPAPVNRDLQLFLTGQYSGPSADETMSETDPRLPGAWSYEVTLQQVILTLGLLYRIPLPMDWVRPYVAAGGRMYLTRTEVSGESGGMPYGDNEETATNFGGYGALGGDFFVGPGSILFEVQFGYAAIDGKVLQNTNAGALNVALGYRIFL